ncbi:hypothetical protein RB195_015255 [Necator americanus]|uniref:Exonuclease domain-containing protein n=1 Tax=Necator americanus TaxID=51031 RepID=A0ABR1E3Q5_NECAM
MDKKKDRHLRKMKKKINELFLMGSISEEEAHVIDLAESNMAARSSCSTDSAEPTVNNGLDSSMKISRKLAAARYQRQPGPQLSLNLERLGGAYMSNAEVRELIQYSVIGPVVNKPKWAHFRPWKSTSQTILIRINCPDDYIENNEFSFSFIDNFFDKRWIRMDSAVGDRETFWNHIMQVPVSFQEQIRERVLKMDPLEGLARGQEMRTEMLLTTAEMVDNNYPFPDGVHIATKERYAPVTKDSPIFALDCEMCVTSVSEHELTRISLIREDGSVVLDTLVKPKNEITDYLTKFSGITPKLMEPVTTTLEDVQAAICAVLPPDAILCGHSLEFDLRAMQMAHPYCIDISLIYNLSGTGRIKTSLKNLMSLFFDEDIQNSHGHCSVEDAWSAMRLLKMKLENGLVYGNCRYGWHYDNFMKEKHAQDAQKEFHSFRGEAEIVCGTTDLSPPEDFEPAAKRSRVQSRERRICGCGETIGVDCILEDCQCHASPPPECLKCLVRNAVPFSEGDFDWSKALRAEYCSSFRPLSYYLVDSKKTVMCGFADVRELNIQKNKVFTLRRPTSFNSISDYVDEVSCDLLEYGLALVEIDYMRRQEEYSSEEDEEGEVCDGRWRMQRAVHELDGHIERVVRAAARYSLVMVVMASEKSSVCYLKLYSQQISVDLLFVRVPSGHSF